MSLWKTKGEKGQQHFRLLRAEKAEGDPEKLLRTDTGGLDTIVSVRAKEKVSRNFAKAYAYRIYTSAWVTPLITVAVLKLRQKYGLSIGQTAGMQGVVEFVVKPFTYAFFEWGAAHVKWGYADVKQQSAKSEN